MQFAPDRIWAIDFTSTRINDQCSMLNFQCLGSDGKIGSMKKPAARLVTSIDCSLYAGRWIAIVRDRVAGVGRTADEARRAAKVSRPKDDPQVVYVPRNYRRGDKLMG
jgi:hypothetical protein